MSLYSLLSGRHRAGIPPQSCEGTSVTLGERRRMTNDRPVEKARILMVDDLRANLLALTTVLEPLGHDLVSAHSGADALRLALEREFAVILMDVQMPALDGFQTTRLLKEHP